MHLPVVGMERASILSLKRTGTQKRGLELWPAARVASWCKAVERARGLRVMMAFSVGLKASMRAICAETTTWHVVSLLVRAW